MTLLVTPAEMRSVEQAAFDAGLIPQDLMRAAAEGIVRWIDDISFANEPGDMPRNQRHVVGLVGPGNNGGDTLVALALLRQLGWHVSAVLLGRTEFGSLPVDAASLNAVSIAGLSSLRTADVILDGVYGIGSRTTLPTDAVTAFAAATEARFRTGALVLAIDVPSGIDAETGTASEHALYADATLCLGLPKIGLVREPAAAHVGELVLIDIGIDEPTDDVNVLRPRLLGARDVRPLLPRRATSAHKSDTGTLLIVAGAPGYYGAPRLCGVAALRAGAGLVALAVPEMLVPTIAGAVPELVVVPLSASGNEAEIEIERFAEARASTLRAVVVGPGLGTTSHVDDLLERSLGSAQSSETVTRVARLPHVIDADGLNWIARRGSWPEKLLPGSTVLTPHAGELARLLNVDVATVRDDPWDAARRVARASGQFVVLKLGHTAIAAPGGELWLAPRSMPEMATAGTGDVLAGTIGGFLAQGVPPFDAARLAVYVGSQAGLAAKRRLGTLSVVAGDIIDALPQSLSRLSSPYAY